MKLYFSLALLTHGMEILSFIFKPRPSDVNCLNLTDVASSISPNPIIFLVIHYIELVWTLFFEYV